MSGEGKKGGLTLRYLTNTFCKDNMNYGLTVDMMCINSGDDEFTYIAQNSNSC